MLLIMPHHYHHPHFISTTTITITISLYFSLLPALPVLPNPDPVPITQQQQFHPTPTPPAITIPSFPEQTAVSTCPLHLPAPLFPAVKSACGGGQLYKDRCCPVLAVWIYSTYTHTALLTTPPKTPPTTSKSYYDMPLIPEDSETCIDGFERRMKDNGVDLIRPNETCDVVYCFCGIELHPLSCPQAFGVNDDGSLRLVDQGNVNKLEKDCMSSDDSKISNDNGGCSKCLKSLYKLKKGQRLQGNTTKWERRTSKMRSRDCELMGLTWLLNKDRDAYISTVTQVMRALMMDTQGSNPRSCSLSSDGMPLAVDSVAINGNGHSSSVPLRFPVVVYFLSIMLLVMC